MNTPESFALPNQRGSLGFRVSAGGSCCRLANNPLHAQRISHYRKHIEQGYRASRACSTVRGNYTVIPPDTPNYCDTNCVILDTKCIANETGKSHQPRRANDNFEKIV